MIKVTDLWSKLQIYAQCQENWKLQLLLFIFIYKEEKKYRFVSSEKGTFLFMVHVWENDWSLWKLRKYGFGGKNRMIKQKKLRKSEV